MQQIQKLTDALQKRIAAAQNDKVQITPLNLNVHKFPQNLALYDVKFPEDPISHVVTVSGKIECDCLDGKFSSYSPVEMKCKHKLAVLFREFDVDQKSDILEKKFLKKEDIEELQLAFDNRREQRKAQAKSSKKRKITTEEEQEQEQEQEQPLEVPQQQE